MLDVFVLSRSCALCLNPCFEEMTQIIWKRFSWSVCEAVKYDALFIGGTSAVRIIVLATGFQAVKKRCMNSNLITAIVSAGMYNMEACFFFV